MKREVAVITGAASGIGRGIAEKCVQRDMDVVLADIDVEQLDALQDQLKRAGARVLVSRTDVANRSEITGLANAAYGEFGKVTYLFNNAGVSASNTIWDMSEAEWQRILGVNLYGVIHGIREFVPRMMQSGEEGFIVNVSSAAGLWPGDAFMAPYSITKHAVVALSESLFQEMRQLNTGISVAVFCPSAIKTDIVERAVIKLGDVSNPKVRALLEERAEFARSRIEDGISVEEAVDILFQQIEDGAFYIMTHPRLHFLPQLRAHRMARRQPPLSPFESGDAIKKMLLRRILPFC